MTITSLTTLNMILTVTRNCMALINCGSSGMYSQEFTDFLKARTGVSPEKGNQDDKQFGNGAF